MNGSPRPGEAYRESIAEALADGWRFASLHAAAGGAGPVGTQYAKTADPLYDAWIQAALAAGLPVTDD